LTLQRILYLASKTGVAAPYLAFARAFSSNMPGNAIGNHAGLPGSGTSGWLELGRSRQWNPTCCRKPSEISVLVQHEAAN
jgi:hypothetical protein